MPRRARRGGGVPRAVPERLRDRRPVPAGHAAGGRARGDRRDRRGQRRPDAGARGRRAAGARHPGAQLRGGDPPRPGARRRAEVLPADLPRVLRAPLVRARRRPARLHDHRRRCRGAVRSRPDLHARPTSPASTCTSRSARTCGCRCRRAPRPRSPVPRCSPTSPAARSPWPAPRTAGCWSAAPASAATRRTSSRPPARASRPPTCRGTARRWSTSAATCSPRPSGSPTDRGASVADVDLDRIRQERLRQGTFDDNRRGARRAPRVPHDRLRARRRPAATSGCAARSTASRSCPTTRERLALDCYEAYNIQVSGLEQRLARDRPAQDHHRRLRRARLHARPDRRGQGDGPARPPAQRHPRVHAARLRDRRDHEVLRHPALDSRSA